MNFSCEADYNDSMRAEAEMMAQMAAQIYEEVEFLKKQKAEIQVKSVAMTKLQHLHSEIEKGNIGNPHLFLNDVIAKSFKDNYGNPTAEKALYLAEKYALPCFNELLSDYEPNDFLPF